MRSEKSPVLEYERGKLTLVFALAVAFVSVARTEPVPAGSLCNAHTFTSNFTSTLKLPLQNGGPPRTRVANDKTIGSIRLSVFYRYFMLFIVFIVYYRISTFPLSESRFDTNFSCTLCVQCLIHQFSFSPMKSYDGLLKILFLVHRSLPELKEY